MRSLTCDLNEMSAMAALGMERKAHSHSSVSMIPTSSDLRYPVPHRSAQTNP